MTANRPLVLVLGRLIDHAVSRIKATYETLHLPTADLAAISDADRERVVGIASGFALVDAKFIDAFPNLEIIACFGVGYDSIDATHAGSRGIMVTNTPDVLTDEVADTTVALLLITLRQLYHAESWLREGRWEKTGPFPLSPSTLRGRSIGIFGMGRIGLAVARRLQGFGVSIAYHNRRPVEGVEYAYHPTLKGLAESVDTLINVAPSTPQTVKAVNAEILAALGPNGVFVNVGRGATVDQDALIEALRTKTIFSAGLDVFADEPRVPQALIDLPNATLLPHVASASQHTRQAMGDLQVDNLDSWFSQSRAITAVPETAHVVRGSR